MKREDDKMVDAVTSKNAFGGQDGPYETSKISPYVQRIIDNIPHFTQRQDSLTEQLIDLRAVAVRLGMYDADEFLARRT